MIMVYVFFFTNATATEVGQNVAMLCSAYGGWRASCCVSPHSISQFAWMPSFSQHCWVCV